MRTPGRDLSIANRLTIGSLILLAILVAGLSFVLTRQSRSSDLQREFATGIVPRVAASHSLEEQLLSLAITVRAYLLTAESVRLQQYQEAVMGVRKALDRASSLMAGTTEADGAARLKEGVSRYLRLVEQVVARVTNGGVDDESERQMRETRLTVQAILREIVGSQQVQADVALAAINDAGRDVWRALMVMAVSLVVCLLLFTWTVARSITVPVSDLLRVASSLEAGDWQPALKLRPGSTAADGGRPRDEMSVLARAFGAAAGALERRTQRLAADRDVASATASTLDKATLATRALRVASQHLDADIAAVYWRDAGSDVLEPLAHRALHDHLAPVGVGEGLLGAAVRERRAIVVSDIPADTPFAVRLGVDNVPPRVLVAVPLVVRDDVLGVLLVGALRPLDDDAVNFLEGVGCQLAIGLQNVAAHEQIERLFDDLRESNQQVQMQSEELQTQNEEIQAQNEELHAQHDEIQLRTEALEHQGADLRAHALLLMEADERKNEFLGVLAHELRNPLAPMVTSLYLLRRAPAAGEVARKAQDVIDRQVRHLSRLTDDLLDVTRISRGKVTLQRERLDLVDVVRECIDDQRSALEARSQHLELDLPAAPLWVHGDRTRLCQVLSNLLSNAVKFSEGRTTISITLQSAGQHAVIEVVDQGCGIEPVFLPDIFQPFTQGAAAKGAVSGGLGLGLALVKALVELHEGAVHAHSDGAGQGARFVVHLPLDQSSAAAPPPVADAAPVVPRRILLIEDNVDAAVTLGAALSLQGHEIDMAHTGSDGLARAAEFAPHVVLCDLGLPDIDGYTVARRLRGDARLNGAVLIAVSGYAAARDRARAEAAGFDHHLAKPVTVEHLAATLGAYDPADASSDGRRGA